MMPLKFEPDKMIIDTTILCNSHCSFCWRAKHGEYLAQMSRTHQRSHTMPFDIYKKIIDDVVQYPKFDWLSMSGPMGEPLLNADIGLFAEYAFKKNFFRRMTINTNGLALEKHDLGRLLNSLNEISFSIDTIHRDTYRRMHGIDCMDKAIDNAMTTIRYKADNGCAAKVVVRFTENEYNLGQYKEYEAFFLDAGVDDINYTKVHSFAGGFDNTFDRQGTEECDQPRKVINFNFLGQLTTCCVNWEMTPTFGNIMERTLRELWNGAEHLEWMDRNPDARSPCRQCGGLGQRPQKTGLMFKKCRWPGANGMSGAEVDLFPFPFHEIPARSRVVIYGAGRLGYGYYKQATALEYCDIVLIVDQEYEERDGFRGIRVRPVADLRDVEYDYVVLAAKSGRMREEMTTSLLEVGVSPTKIVDAEP